MTSRERFLQALALEPLDRPPVWIMRQAGRYLPEYRALKEQHSFVKMVQTPELAVEVTLQPLRRFELDAAIVFSDILVIPEAMGQAYHFKETGGIAMDFTLSTAADIGKLESNGIPDRLNYVTQALQLLRKELGQDTALLGFGGSPWTLAAYMLEGGGSKSWSKAKALFWEEPSLFHQLMEKLCDALSDYFLVQIEAGVDAIQIFDSWGAACPGRDYPEMSLRWIQQVISRLPEGFPIILYAKGMAEHADNMAETGARILSVDWTVNLPEFHDGLPEGVGLQGNLDPAILDTNPDLTRAETRRFLEDMQGKPGHIFNLGHGIYPSASPDNVAALVETVCAYPES